MRPRCKPLRLLVALVIGPTSVEGRGSCRVDAYGWKRVGVVNEFLYLVSPDVSEMSAGA